MFKTTNATQTLSEWETTDMGPPVHPVDTPRYRSDVAESYLAAES